MDSTALSMIWTTGASPLVEDVIEVVPPIAMHALPTHAPCSMGPFHLIRGWPCNAASAPPGATHWHPRVPPTKQTETPWILQQRCQKTDKQTKKHLRQAKVKKGIGLGAHASARVLWVPMPRAPHPAKADLFLCVLCAWHDLGVPASSPLPAPSCPHPKTPTSLQPLRGWGKSCTQPPQPAPQPCPSP
jgi:hypothetical protein